MFVHTRPIDGTRLGLQICSTATVLALAATGPAAAQGLSADDAWTNLQALAAGAGLSITTTGVASAAEAVTAQGVRIFPTNDPNDLVIRMDSLRVEPRGEMMALIPSPVVHVDTLFAGGIVRQFEITHSGEIVGMLSETNGALDLDFASLVAQMLPAQSAKGAPLPGAFSMDFTGLDASLRASSEGAAEITIDIGSVTYDLSYRDPYGSRTMVSQAGTMTAPRLTFTGTELDMLSDEDGMLRTAFDAGFSAQLAFSVQGGDQTSSQMLEGVPLSMETSSGAGEISIDLVDGRIDIAATGGAASMSGSYGPMAGSATLGGMDMALGMPLVATPEDQPFRYMVSLRDLAPSPELVTMLGAGQFAGESVTVTLDLGADGRLTQELGEDFAESDVPPVDFSAVRLDDLRLAVGDSALTGAGAVELIGGLLAQIGRPMPEANGDFTFDLVGGERLLTRLQSMGVVPQDQLFFVRMMLNGLGRSVGEDHLQSEVAIRPGGVVTVNGAPLPF